MGSGGVGAGGQGRQGRQGDKETRRQGDKETRRIILSPHPPLSPSPPLPIPPSPHSPLPTPHSLVIFLDICKESGSLIDEDISTKLGVSTSHRRRNCASCGRVVPGNSQVRA
ncbi:hypothetical protein PI95_006650 [Hassallia byssoidea VB512170]|uniref:Uncharacterized protein n=1 Tax=Hassallia byssoidea VB512170 TaxID=1304833 RepID=A0A846H5L1_9CYAN|nr:hypothetical protein [Hassalia byssoidea]NEU72258.1 hypothetical protein [Hassalia byssoidea VB512170]